MPYNRAEFSIIFVVRHVLTVYLSGFHDFAFTHAQVRESQLVIDWCLLLDSQHRVYLGHPDISNARMTSVLATELPSALSVRIPLHKVPRPHPPRFTSGERRYQCCPSYSPKMLSFSLVVSIYIRLF